MNAKSEAEHAAIQSALERYPDFQPKLDSPRVLPGRQVFYLGAAFKYRTAKEREVWQVTAHPGHIARALALWLAARTGVAVLSGASSHAWDVEAARRTFEVMAAIARAHNYPLEDA